ncbi:unnamed protein product [Alternaria alternata]
MAEVVGAVAAVVQFVDVALRLSSCLERFCSDVRNVPRRFLQLQIDLRQQIEIAQHIQNDHVPDFATTVSSSTLDAPLLEYISLADELSKTLERLLTRKNDGMLQRGWSGICSLSKKEEVANICDRLDQKRSILSIWLNAANLKLSSETAATIDKVRLEIGETLTLVKTVDKTSSATERSTARLLPHVEQIDQSVSATSEKAERIIQDLQYLKSQSMSLLTDRDVNITAQESSRQTTATILSYTEQILQAIEKLNSDSDRASLGTRDGFVVSKLSVDAPDTRLQRSAKDCIRKSRRCRCRTVGTARRWQPLSILRFTRTFRTQHFSYCPDYLISEQSLEITMQLVPLSWLLSHTINVGTRVRNWSTVNPFSICPVVVGTSRLVDSKTSPAFRAIVNTIKELSQGEQHHVSIPRLQNTLQDLFDEKEASVLDINNDGTTILMEIVGLFVNWPYIISRPGDEYINIIHFLLERGADPNVLTDPRPNAFSYVLYSQNTACDLLAAVMGSGLRNLPQAEKSRFLDISERIVEAGGHTSRPIQRYVSQLKTSFRDDIERLSLFEDQIDIRDLGDLVPVILRQRQPEQFLRLTHKAKLSALNHASSIDGLAPIHFAVLWPTGLKMLLDRGVLVNPEDIYGRRPIHLAVVLGITDSVRYLLAEDCGLFTPPSGDSLLQFALRLKEPEKSQILRLLVPALIDRYKRLQNMASRFLPPSIFSKFELAPGQSREQKAPSMIETLIAHGIDVPQALELDGKGFYNFADHFSSIKMAPETASAFWDAGFREIDTPDNNGLTPFLQSWFSADFEMVDWFAQRGILMRSEHKSTPLTALHFYSARLRFPGDGFARDVNAVPTSEHYMDMIRKEMGIPYDDCRCACSPGGCAPIKFLFDPDIEDGMRKPRIRKWLENVRPSQALELEYVYHLTRYLLFDFLDGEHTCCYLGLECSIHYNVSRRERFMIKFGGQTGGSHERYDEHLRLCASGLPIPQRECLQALRDPDIFGKTLNSAMSHYDEMDRPDTMPLEEQAFKYINWLLIEGHLDIDVSYECEHWRRW